MNHDRYKAILSDAGAHFTSDCASHTMTVLREDGLYRHLRFHAEHSSSGFDLITWPGSLTVQGGHGTHTFSRSKDMFGFFRQSNGVNVDYWAEKLPGGRESVKKFAEHGIVRMLVEAYREYGTWLPRLEADYERDLAVYEAAPRERRWPFDLQGPRQPVKPRTVAELREQVRDAHGNGDLGYEDGVRRLLADWDSAGVTSDSWELDLREYDYHFVWSCHAIAWGIGQYDAVKAAPVGELVEAVAR